MKKFGLILILMTNFIMTLIGLFIIQLTSLIEQSTLSNPYTYVVIINLIIVWVPTIFILVNGVKKWYIFYGIYGIFIGLAGIFLPITFIITLFYILGAASLKSSLNEQPT